MTKNNHKNVMKRLILLVFVILLISGCSTPAVMESPLDYLIVEDGFRDYRLAESNKGTFDNPAGLDEQSLDIIMELTYEKEPVEKNNIKIRVIKLNSPEELPDSSIKINKRLAAIDMSYIDRLYQTPVETLDNNTIYIAKLAGGYEQDFFFSSCDDIMIEIKTTIASPKLGVPLEGTYFMKEILSKC
jgi:hypothetical protein